jgi:hypothetical protein
VSVSARNEPIFALRICVLSFRTHRDRMEQAIADLRAAAQEALETDRDRGDRRWSRDELHERR